MDANTSSSPLAAAPRPLVGFSDGTALLSLAARAGVAAIHGPVVTQLGGLPTTDQQALVQFSLMVGALTLARATQGEPLSDEILEATVGFLIQS